MAKEFGCALTESDNRISGLDRSETMLHFVPINAMVGRMWFSTALKETVYNSIRKENTVRPRTTAGLPTTRYSSCSNSQDGSGHLDMATVIE